MIALAENIRVALDGLLANKLRSSLTMLGVIIGVAAVVALMSVGHGASAAITDRISSVGTNLLIVTPGAVSSGPVRGQAGSATSLTYEDALALAEPNAVAGAFSVAPEFSSRGQVVYGDSNANVSVVGTSPAYMTAMGLEIALGRFVDSDDVARRSKVAVLGSEVASDLFSGMNPIGEKIKLSSFGQGSTKTSLTVIGVLAEQGGSFMTDADSGIIVPITTAQTRLFSGRNPFGEPVVTRINVSAVSEDVAEAVEANITSLLMERHEIVYADDADFSVMSQAEMLEMATEVSGILTIFLGAIAGISLLVGGIGIMNIMLVSVTERTREIGLRKAVGARKSDILSQFMLESIVLSVLGGLLGVLAGLGVAKIVDLSGLMRAVPTASSVVLALCAAIAVGVFLGLYPANRAAGLRPIEALRYE